MRNIKDVDVEIMQYAFEIVKHKKYIEELEIKIEKLREEQESILCNHKPHEKLKITPFDLGEF